MIPFSLAVVFLIGCESGSVQNLTTPDSLTLYSIDGRDFVPGTEPKADEEFHGYPVLGKIDVKDPKSRREIIAAVKKGIADSDGMMAKCFWPRHAIRATENGKTIEYVICFECNQLQIYTDGTDELEPTTREPQVVLNKHLQDAKIPLAPGMVGDDD